MTMHKFFFLKFLRADLVACYIIKTSVSAIAESIAMAISIIFVLVLDKVEAPSYTAHHPLSADQV